MVIWTCKIGDRSLDKETLGLPPGADSPMRRAVADAYAELTGFVDEFLFSGWGEKTLTAGEIAAIEHTVPSNEHYRLFKRAEHVLAGLGVSYGEDEEDMFSPTHERYMNALSALTEALEHNT